MPDRPVRAPAHRGRVFLVLAAALLAAGGASAQSRIRSMPGHASWEKNAPLLGSAVKYGSLTAQWSDDSRSFDFTLNGRPWRFDVGRLAAEPIAGAPDASPDHRPVAQPPLILARGADVDASVLSPDGQRRAFTRNGNLYLSRPDGSGETAVTFDGGKASRIRYGVGSYVYLEEFGVRSPVWWSPDGRRLAFMRYDETRVSDYFLQLDHLKPLSSVHVQAYPHPGSDNPVADLMILEVETGIVRRMDVRGGAPFSDTVIGHYVFGGQWLPDGSGFLIRRSDRLQKTIELAICDPSSSACRTLARESRPQTFAQSSSPTLFGDSRRLLWISEANDFRNIVLIDIAAGAVRTLTDHAFDVVDIVKVDERGGWIWYTARSGDNHMKTQLHRMRIDGGGDRRLTDPAFHHEVRVSPDGRWFVDVAQAYDTPPVTSLRDRNGESLAVIATSDASGLETLGVPPPKQFGFLAADGVTPLKGLIRFPSGFDPGRRYPVLVSVYGGPGARGLSETFAAPNPISEFGFLHVQIDARTALGLGRRALDSIYKQIGVAEVDDIAEGLRALAAFPFVDGERIGVYGTSYGGTVAALLLMRYPDLVRAASAHSAVADFRLYDTAYSERYLGLPLKDPDAYDRAALSTYIGGLRGDLMLYYGTSDDNVHPKNTLQFARALSDRGVSFDMQVGPDRGHTSLDSIRMMEFFIERMSQPARPQAAP